MLVMPVCCARCACRARASLRRCAVASLCRCIVVPLHRCAVASLRRCVVASLRRCVVASSGVCLDPLSLDLLGNVMEGLGEICMIE